MGAVRATGRSAAHIAATISNAARRGTWIGKAGVVGSMRSATRKQARAGSTEMPPSQPATNANPRKITLKRVLSAPVWKLAVTPRIAIRTPVQTTASTRISGKPWT